MEHSLIALSKWESQFQKPYIGNEQLSVAERIYYYECMVLNGVKPEWDLLEEKHITLMENYMNNPMTATVIQKDGGGDGSYITSELLYAYMAIAGLDKTCEEWHLNRLIMTLNVISELQAEKKPMPEREIMNRQAQLNEERKRKLNSKG